MESRDRILITGANGFVGRALVKELLGRGYRLTLATRRPGESPATGDLRYAYIPSVGSATDWSEALRDCDRVVHLAAQVPLPGATSKAFSEVNDKGTARLVQQVLQHEVRAFVLLSSVAAVSDRFADRPVDEETIPHPTSDYGRSKRAAEEHLNALVAAGRHALALRPSMIYNGGAKGNWRSLQALASTRLPLPFAGVHNRRSLTALDNLVDGIAHLLQLPGPRLQSGNFMICDREPVSLREIITWLRAGMNRPANLIWVPKTLLRVALNSVGRSEIADSLLQNLEVDSSRFCELFEWRPKVKPEEGIRRSGAEFVQSRAA